MKIEAYSFGSITVDGKIYDKDLIVFPDRVLPNWRRKEGHALSIDDLREVLEFEPEVLVIGCGWSSCMKILRAADQFLEDKHIRVIAKSTGEACPIFNQELDRGGKVAGAFHLTC
ncbi:MAG: MTH938/NDUFAF3 family protein [Candidatus Omnitrophica bacterium]|nr:MTH938/NDUFAF3 family protein [Candidatus Omnitrophota bacterium]